MNKLPFLRIVWQYYVSYAESRKEGICSMEKKGTVPADINSIEENLNSLESELQNHYSQMGRTVLELADHEQRIIDELIAEIIELKTAIHQKRNEIQCPNCMKFNAAESNYCRFCGEALFSEKQLLKGES